jgi:NAD(P)-dependent dehydrogenase (short-subunit alcohol dehydrogenase family)
MQAGDTPPVPAARTAVVVGASGGIGAAIVDALDSAEDVDRVIAASRRPIRRTSAKIEPVAVDLLDEASIASLADTCREPARLDLVIVATGILHDGEMLQPEKRLADIDPAMLARAFAVNTAGPALLAKHLLPRLARDRPSRFAAISARVGSIGDNRLGGWYAYRASKAALNMVIRTAAIELSRSNPGAACIGLHPGTVATRLSAPFRSRVARDNLFSPTRAATQLLRVIAASTPAQSGRCLAWDGTEVPP